MKMVRLLLLGGLLAATSIPSHAVPQCTQAYCDSLCGGPGTGQCYKNRCLCP